MPFDYYDRLTAPQKRIYRQSDAVASIRLADPAPLQAAAVRLRAALEADKRAAVQTACSEIARGICDDLGVTRAEIEVLAVRPRRSYGELHGLYSSDSEGSRIQVWMRTAHHKRVVAFRTFLRTLLHELCHHLDYYHLKLGDSYHTEGFFKRESSLFRQLVPERGAEDHTPSLF